MPEFTGLHFALMGGNLIAGTAIGWFARVMTFDKHRIPEIDPKTDPETVLDILAGVSKNTSDSSAGLRSFETRVLAGEGETDPALIAEVRQFGQNYAEQMQSDIPRVSRVAEDSDGVLRQVVQDLIRHSSNIDQFNEAVGDEIDRSIPGVLRELLGIAISNLLDSNRHLERQLNEARRELTQKRAELKDARRDARIDSLTKINNRRAFDERLDGFHAGFARSQKAFSLVMFDLDNFKAVNDAYGHLVGDVVLQVFAKVLQDGLRADDVAARIGGEEFAVILEETAAREATQISDRIRRHASTKIVRANNSQVTFTVSAGVAEIQPGESTHDLLKRADEALYQAKCMGRNCVQAHDPAVASSSQPTVAALVN